MCFENPYEHTCTNLPSILIIFLLTCLVNCWIRTYIRRETCTQEQADDDDDDEGTKMKQLESQTFQFTVILRKCKAVRLNIHFPVAIKSCKIEQFYVGTRIFFAPAILYSYNSCSFSKSILHYRVIRVYFCELTDNQF